MIVFWHWWALGAVLIGIEMLIPSTWLVGPAASAALVGLAALIAPVLNDEAQIILFAVAAAGLTFVWQRRVRRHPPERSPLRLNRRAHALVGRRTALTTLLPSAGGEALKLDDTVWRARPADGNPIPAGATVEVVGAEGSLLLVRPVA